MPLVLLVFVLLSGDQTAEGTEEEAEQTVSQGGLLQYKSKFHIYTKNKNTKYL